MKSDKHFTITIFSLFAVILTIITLGSAQVTGVTSGGENLYTKHCLICHGDKGLGDGPAARFLDPKPRDFTSGVFKIRSTPSLPTDEDIFRTLTRGIPGTLMPSFVDLTGEERWDLVAYVKSFSEAFQSETPTPISFPDPPPETEELLALGEKLYNEAGCVACHGQFGKGDGPAAKTLQDEWGNPIIPYDFTVPGRMKGGSTVNDVYRSFSVGIGGTPMPAYGEIYSEEQNWALSYYALSLAEEEFLEEFPLLGNSITGRDLFTGITPLENGGSPCIACHSVTGIGALGGGVMGPDLTRTHNKFGEYGIATILTAFPFPVMNPLFSENLLTEQEQVDLAAFLQETVARRPTQAIGRLVMMAGSGTVILFLLANLPWRRRLTEVRRPMVKRKS
ncbi:MAG: c-type cytochrome [Candidatus Neomarinimicrobiota bacterium]